MKFPNPLHHTFGPHVTHAYLKNAWEALKTFVLKGDEEEPRTILKQSLERHFSAPVCLFALGREALLAGLQALDLKSDDEIIVQGYTCVVVPNAIRAAGGTPVFADIDPDTLNLTRETVEAMLSPRTRAIICQHTFGIPAPLHELRALCNERNILLIEDCAHIIPETIIEGGIGNVGDMVILSFGRDKAISGIIGGAIVLRNPRLHASIEVLARQARALSNITIIRILLYPFRMRYIVQPLVGTIFGRIILRIMKECGCISAILTDEEKEGVMETTLHTLPSPCAALAKENSDQLAMLNAHRRSIAAVYHAYGTTHGWPMLSAMSSSIPLQKFPLFTEDANTIRTQLKRYNVHLDDGWTGCVICPEAVDPKKIGYCDGSDPHAEQSAKKILSLPIHSCMTEEHALQLCKLIDPMLAPHNLR